MPTYEYECSNCGYRFEEFQGINDAPLKKCPKCKKLKLKRLISAGAGLIFKGSGFYITDYKKKKEKPTGTSSEKTSDTTSSKSSTESSKSKSEK